MAKMKLRGLTLHQLIDRHSINKAHLASKMKMPVGTFKNKLSDNQPIYKFTEEEENKLKEILLDMAADIQEAAGMTFNEALKKIAK
jgi:uncharacterized protein YbgA (DUF1722 family)